MAPPAEGTLIAEVESNHLVGSSIDPSDLLRVDVTSAPLISVPLRVENQVVEVHSSCVIHPFYIHKMDSGPVRLMTIAHAFNYRVAVLRDGVHLRIAIPSSGNPPGEVPNDCFPRIDDIGITKMPKRVSIAPVCQTSTGETDPLTTDQDTTPTESPTVTIQPVMEGPRTQKTREESTVPPPGFRPFQWPQAGWDDIGDATLDPGLKFVCDELVSQNIGGEVVPTSSRTALAYNSGGLPGSHHGANGYSNIGSVQSDGTRSDPVSTSASATPTVKNVNPVRKAGAGR